MPRIAVSLAVAALIFAAACEKHATVLPTDPKPPGVPVLVVTINTDRGTLDAGSSQPATLTVTAKEQNGTPAGDGSDLTLNTSLGQFGVDASGNPVRLMTTKLSGGTATVPFYAGTEVGTASVLAQVGTSTGKLNIAITQPPTMPAADFNVETNGLKAIFTDASTGNPTTRLWEFGDGGTSSETNPIYEYRAAGVYTAKLTVSNAGGSTSKSKFVTVTSGPPLTASFTYSANGLTVLFTDTSTGGPTSWQWDFGDGKPFDTRQNPQHVYDRAGTYIVFLTVRGPQGQSATTSQFLTVGGAAPAADFKFSANGLTVNFSDASTGNPTSWSWDFGDGGKSTAQNPSHTYAAAGTYNVTLTATNVGGSTSKSQFVTVSLGSAPKAAFTFAVSGRVVLFTDTSTGNPTAWSWDFGDGGKSTQQNPSHTYSAAGTYKVTLTAANAAGESSVSQFVTTVTAPVAEFTASPVPTNALVINFVDQSSNSPTAWAWNFGDCGVSPKCTDATQNPTHTYAAPGQYTVLLTASNSAGQHTRQKIIAVGEPVASFTYAKDPANGLKVTFTDTSTNAPTTWLWSFGDGTTSSERNPVHTYAAAGTYTVRLTATNAGGSDVSVQQVVVP